VGCVFASRICAPVLNTACNASDIMSSATWAKTVCLTKRFCLQPSLHEVLKVLESGVLLPPSMARRRAARPNAVAPRAASAPSPAINDGDDSMEDRRERLIGEIRLLRNAGEAINSQMNGVGTHIETCHAHSQMLMDMFMMGTNPTELASAMDMVSGIFEGMARQVDSLNSVTWVVKDSLEMPTDEGAESLPSGAESLPSHPAIVPEVVKIEESG